MIVIIDYDMGNVGSIKNMLKYLGYESLITSDLDEIEKAEKLILPGVGAFDNGMKNLEPMIEVLNNKVLDNKTPILGICLGMQLMTKKSEEGKLSGLKWIDAETKKLKIKENLKIPHMGWNLVDIQNKKTLFKNMYENARFYFVHSYYVECKDKNDILALTSHSNKFVSSFQKKNVYGTQFHPEKSHKFGMRLLKNFVEEC